HRQYIRYSCRKNSLDLAIKILPLRIAQEIVHNEEAAVEEVAAQDGHLFVFEPEGARLDDVDPGKVEQIRVSQPDDTSVGIDQQRGHLLEPEGKIQVAVVTIGPPAPTPLR